MLKFQWPILFFIIGICCQVIFAETLPPLPIERLKKIELFYPDTLIVPGKLDSFYLRIFGGNIFGGDIKYLHLIGKRTLVKLNTFVQNNRDYSTYWCENSQVNLGWLKKSSWQEVNLISIFKKRQDQKYYNFGFGYQPVWFFHNSGLFFDTQGRLWEYDDVVANRFIISKFNVSFNKPTKAGVINISTDNLLRTELDDAQNYQYYSSVGIADLMMPTNNFYVKPALNYRFFYHNNIFSPKALNFVTSLGLGIPEFITAIDFSYNNVEPFVFDTLYGNVFPYLVNKDLMSAAQKTQILLNWTFKFSTISLGGSYQRFCSSLNWQQDDAWFVPEIINDGYEEIKFNFSNDWQFLENSLVISYIFNPKKLMPKYTITDSMRIKIKNWQLLGGINVIGERDWYSQDLPIQTILMSQLSYERRAVKCFVRFNNLLNCQYEILPSKFDKGIKYCFGFEFYK